MSGDTGDDRPAPSSPPPGASNLPAWASRHLAEADGAPTVTSHPVTPSTSAAAASAASLPGGPGSQHRRGRGSSRLRGWGLAVAAVAAAVGVVPLAVSTLARQEVPLPQVGTFPVVAPEILGDGPVADPSSRGSTGTPGSAEPGPAAVAVLPPLVSDDEEDSSAAPRPAVPAAPRFAAPAAPPRHGRPKPRSAPRPTRTTTTTAPDDDSDGPDDGEETTPREATSSRTATSTSRGDSGSGLVGGLVEGVGDTAGRLLG